MLYRICKVQIQPGNYVLDHAGYTAPTRQHDEPDYTDEENICPERSTSITKCETFNLPRRHSSGAIQQYLTS